jgi:putative endonuclease
MHFSEKWYFVYIMTNRSKTLYTGITGHLRKRVFEHKTGVFKGFTSKYKIDRLVYFERFKYVRHAIAREKQIKGWRKTKKIQLIVSINPTWKDLAADWFPELNT